MIPSLFRHQRVRILCRKYDIICKKSHNLAHFSTFNCLLKSRNLRDPNTRASRSNLAHKVLKKTMKDSEGSVYYEEFLKSLKTPESQSGIYTGSVDRQVSDKSSECVVTAESALVKHVISQIVNSPVTEIPFHEQYKNRLKQSLTNDDAIHLTDVDDCAKNRLLQKLEKVRTEEENFLSKRLASALTSAQNATTTTRPSQPEESQSVSSSLQKHPHKPTTNEAQKPGLSFEDNKLQTLVKNTRDIVLGLKQRISELGFAKSDQRATPNSSSATAKEADRPVIDDGHVLPSRDRLPGTFRVRFDKTTGRILQDFPDEGTYMSLAAFSLLSAPTIPPPLCLCLKVFSMKAVNGRQAHLLSVNFEIGVNY